MILKFNRILLATLLLLTILTIGAVSAADSDDSSYLSSGDDNILADDDVEDDGDWEDENDDNGEDDGEDEGDDDLEQDLYVSSDVDAENVHYNAGNTVIAYLKDLPQTATGTFSIYDGMFLLAQKPVVNGKANFTLSEIINQIAVNNIVVGDHYFYARYDDGKNIYGNTFHVILIDYKITSLSNNIHLGENAVFKVTLPSNVNGYVDVYEDDEIIKSCEVRNGDCSIVLSGLTLGTHEFGIEFDNNEGVYINDFVVVVVSPKKIATVANAYIGADNFFTVTLPTNANGLLSVQIKDTSTKKTKWIEVKYTNGKAVIPASKLAVGSYQIIDFCIEDKKYGDFYFSDMPTYTDKAVYASFKVRFPTFTLNKITTLKRSKTSVTLTASLKASGKTYNAKAITFKFGSKTYSVKTNKNGVAKVTILGKNVYQKFKVGQKVKYSAKYSGKTITYTLQMT